MMIFRGLTLLGVAILLLSLGSVAIPVSAEGGKEVKLGPELASHLKPIRKLLSGRMWLMSSGLDPVLAGMDRKEAMEGASSGGTSDLVLQGSGAGAAALVPYRDPSAKFSRNVLLSQDFGQIPLQTEPHLAVNPNDPDHMVVGLIDYNLPSMVSYSSIDGGETWQGPSQARYPRQDLGVAGDPVVGFDREGNAYAAYISLDSEDYVIGPVVGSAMVSSISVARSDDGAVTWNEAVSSARSEVHTMPMGTDEQGRPRGQLEFGFLDKPWMAIGSNQKGEQQDVVYIAYTKFVSTYSLFWIDEMPFLGSPILETVIEVVHSDDGGESWSVPVEVSPRAQYVIFANAIVNPSTVEEGIENIRQVVQGPSLAVAPDGTVYVAWVDTTNDGSFKGLAEIYVSRSEDAGDSFGNPVRATGFMEPPFRPRTATFRYWATAFPRITTGLDGEVYVIHGGIPMDNPEDDGDIFLVRSTDMGYTWSRRQRVNDDTTGRLQFFPDVTVSSNGTLYAMWGDMRDDPVGLKYHIYSASSEDGGGSWSTSSRVSDFPSNPNRGFRNGLFIGDYFTIQAAGNDVYMVWADTRLGEFGSSNQKIGFARNRLMPAPSIFISPPRGPAGEDVVIQGFNFQPNRDVFIEVSGVIVSTSRTGAEGRFNTQIFMPISGHGAHTVRAIEVSGNVASTSFFMDFGFDNIEEVTKNLENMDVQNLGSVVSASLEDELRQLRASLDELHSKDTETVRPSLPLLPLIGVLVVLGLLGGVVLAIAWRRKNSLV